MKEAISQFVFDQEEKLLENFTQEQKENYAYLLLMKQADIDNHFFKERMDSLRHNNN